MFAMSLLLKNTCRRAGTVTGNGKGTQCLFLAGFVGTGAFVLSVLYARKGEPTEVNVCKLVNKNGDVVWEKAGIARAQAILFRVIQLHVCRTEFIIAFMCKAATRMERTVDSTQ